MTETKPGTEVWALRYDAHGSAAGISVHMFLAVIGGAVIVSPYARGPRGVDEVMQYHMRESSADGCTDLLVFPLGDCYTTKEDALAALEKRRDGA